MYTMDDDFAGEGERAEGEGEGEGSLEDAIASMSIKSPTTSPSTIVADTTKDSTGDPDRESDPSSSSSDAKAVDTVSGGDARSSASSSSPGKTSINVKEAVKYRIRKRMLVPVYTTVLLISSYLIDSGLAFPTLHITLTIHFFL